MAKDDSAQEREAEDMRRTPIPREGQILAVCMQRVGGSRVLAKCMDGKQRNCRIPGRLKRRLWVRERDILLVEPWELGGDEKGDVVFKYKPIQVNVLKKKGLLKFTEDADEF
ncbi:MAG: translation initiation factor eIF-1A [Candidatus Woesearchaeota archaeon]|jgi:translation initiation factor 1A|nr:translation initiation factor eIF-1A [Candidatus Woesearchaeota archaeon]MDP7182136.1 translation initiation factor eIF-1A [Candidatus Woesearchaeota archaeon]MDP7199275.1 translation initiation factor eIF-1A [Candidatus Woesearchaeota archaeon]MDP7467896.1 translation initiation factor eIF-1A [Candidatus Woesearchaeota archaeon]MDP7647898.1 translation initiation factor eIF-1A [Candidatus Woesearchaeota archaeon]